VKDQRVKVPYPEFLIHPLPCIGWPVNLGLVGPISEIMPEKSERSVLAIGISLSHCMLRASQLNDMRKCISVECHYLKYLSSATTGR